MDTSSYSNRSKRNLLLVFSFVLVVFPKMGIVKAEPNTIVVPDDYGSIQEAINNADEGDTVFVKSGTYFENVMINKSLSLIGENWESTIIDAKRAGTPISIIHDNVPITGFTIRNGSCYDRGIDFWAGVDYCNICNISKNRIINNPYGIDVACSSNNIIVGNYLDGNGVGIELGGIGGSNFNSVSGNEIVNSSRGISIMYSYNNSVSQNNIANSGERSIHLL